MEAVMSESSLAYARQGQLPAAFLGHGNPMNALDQNRYTEAWRAFGASVPRPRAILMVSAHWYINGTAVTAMAQPRTIHDFSGFPPELFAVQYPAPGDPELAQEVAELVKPTEIGQDHESWGLDHGTWSVLVHAFPAADVPVVQLSINAQQPFAFHLELGARLAPLRERGVLILGSGDVVHNLRAVAWDQPDAGFDWAQRFDEAARSIMQTAPGEVERLTEHPDYRRAVPTPDHFIPLLYLAGLASAAGQTAEVMIEGCSLGSISMTSYALGARGDVPTHDSGSPPPLPPVPPEETNI
jgi:4,5-DOPA dioxygenase extradiol